MEFYKNWVRRNKDYVHSLESLANGLTWLLPERFSESEIGPEAVTAIVGIITAVNEHIIDSTPTQTHGGSADPHSFPYSLCISAIKDLETVVEVAAQHYYGDDKKWNFLAVTEGIKVCVRLALFRNSGYKMLLHGGVTQNIEKHSDFSGSHDPGVHNGPGQSQNVHGKNAWGLEGRALSALSRFGENARTISDPIWLQRVQHQRALMEPLPRVVKKPTLSTILSEKGVRGALFIVSEMLFISIPLIYVLFIRKYGIRSWIPWFLSLVMDILGMGFLTQVARLKSGENEQQFHFTGSEKDEMRRRKLLWAFYLMRDPFFSKYTRQRLERTEKIMEAVPLIGVLTGKIVELVVGAQTRYTYMSGS